MPVYPPPASGGGGGSVVFFEEGSAVGTATNLNFVGAGVTATYSGGTAIATIPGGTAAGSLIFLDEGATAGTATHLNVVGSGGTVAYSGGTATLTISGGGSPAGKVPVQSKCGAPGTNTNSWNITLDSTPTNGNVIFACIGRDDNGTVTSITQTGVTWTAVVTYSAAAPMITIWKGVVGSGASASLTIAFSSTAFSGAVFTEWSGITGTLDQSATVHVSSAPNNYFWSPAVLPTDVNALVIACATTTSNPTYYRQSGMVGVPDQILNGSPVLAGYCFPGTTPAQLMTVVAGSTGTMSGCIASFT